MNFKRYIFTFFALYGIVYADNSDIIADATRVILPTATLATTYYGDNKEGQREFCGSLASTIGITYGLKYSTNKNRPDKSDNRSFPSGHTSVAFASSAFIHKRYGFKYAIIPYLASLYTGYSRVKNRHHYSEDVVAGAAIGIFSSIYFTTKYKNIKLIPKISKNNYYFSITIFV